MVLAGAPADFGKLIADETAKSAKGWRTSNGGEPKGANQPHRYCRSRLLNVWVKNGPESACALCPIYPRTADIGRRVGQVPSVPISRPLSAHACPPPLLRPLKNQTSAIGTSSTLLPC